MRENLRYVISMDFEEVKFPPFRDILLLGRRCPHGKVGISKCLSLLAPENFEMIELDDATVQAALISKQILKRMPAEKVLGILQEKVFPFITPGETVKVDFNVRMCVENIEGTLEQA